MVAVDQLILRQRQSRKPKPAAIATPRKSERRRGHLSSLDCSRMAILKLVKDKLQKRSSRTKPTAHDHVATEVQERIKEGHFAVLAMQGGESRKFTVALSFLDDQEFLKLLDRSQEEYGFEQHGIITLLCQPCELEDILSRKSKDKKRSFAARKVLARHW